MASTAIQWRAKTGLKEVTVDGEKVIECNLNVPIKLYLPCKTFCFVPKAKKVKLHIFNKAAKIWEDKFKGAELDFRIFEFYVSDTVASVIEKVLSKGRCGSMHPWAVTEVFEEGNGEWSQGLTVPYASKKAASDLANVGWNATRGNTMPPVWLCVHRAD